MREIALEEIKLLCLPPMLVGYFARLRFSLKAPGEASKSNLRLNFVSHDAQLRLHIN